jgi:hypothetical protein
MCNRNRRLQRNRQSYLSKTGRGKNYHILINYTSNQAAAEETLQSVEELGYQEKFLNLM